MTRSGLYRISATALVLAVGSVLGGCGYLFGDSGYFRDTANDYRRSQETPPIRVPEGATGEKLAEIYAIPPIESEPQFDNGDRVPRPAPLLSASSEQLVRIQRLGDDSWALIAIAPGQLWPQLRSFLAAANIDVARMDAKAGIIESTYLKLQDIERPARFRFRVERGVQRGNSELHVLQMFETTSDSWPEQSDDLELESDLLRGIAQFIANSADTAPVSMMAEQSISAGGKVSLQEGKGGGFIVLELPFDRAWASLSRSLELSGFDITDRDRSEGNYFVRYVGDEEERKSGWFGWLSGGDEVHPATGVPLIVNMRSTASERMEIRLSLESAEGAKEGDLRPDQLQSLLALIKGNIT